VGADARLEDDNMIDPKTEHLMTRAKEEAVLAIQADHPAAARAHQGLAVRYSAKAVVGLAEDSGDPAKGGLPPRRTAIEDAARPNAGEVNFGHGGALGSKWLETPSLRALPLEAVYAELPRRT
jgi:hypothetical protein